MTFVFCCNYHHCQHRHALSRPQPCPCWSSYGIPSPTPMHPTLPPPFLEWSLAEVTVRGAVRGRPCDSSCLTAEAAAVAWVSWAKRFPGCGQVFLLTCSLPPSISCLGDTSWGLSLFSPTLFFPLPPFKILTCLLITCSCEKGSQAP